LGLGLGIDYALLMINRFREERKRGTQVADAVQVTLATAGRTVLFSGITVAIVLGSMFFFPQYFLKSFAIGGVVVVLLAVAGALIALPALLNLLGDRVNKLKVIRGELAPKESGLWGGIARFVMRRPLPILLVTLISLGGLMSLAGGAVFGQVDDRVLPVKDPAVIASNVIRDRFSAREGSPVDIIIEGATASQIADYTITLSKQAHIVRVQSTAGIAQGGNLDDGYAPAFTDYATGNFQHIVAIHNIDSRSTQGLDLTRELRKVTLGNLKVLVGGSAASYTDSQLGVERNLPAAAGWIIAWTLILLFLFTGSVLLPIKAVLLNVVSLGATLGFLTWVFIGGHLKWLIGDFFVTGTIDTSSTVLIAIVAFGLSMDYELFLLSRIKEQHEAGLGTTESVAVGLQRSGRIITAAALVLAFSFVAFITSGVTIMKMLGLGIAFAILLDATIVRALLVPALMRLLGDLNWWAPKWMKRIYKKVGLDH
jgi:RND superfamily putative drug exporter